MVKIGFTVGVWDRYHKGHEHLLEEAKKHCDYLVVGIMTDYWVHVQKGHNVGVQSLQLRKETLQKNPNIDKIITLDTLDMSQYLQVMDVWIKGEDQKNMRPFDWSPIVLIPRLEGISSTQLREKE